MSDFVGGRRTYDFPALDPQQLHPEPLREFQAWLEIAREVPNILEPTAMCLATATSEGKPSNRMVLMRRVTEEGLEFFTNYLSRKGREIAENPEAAATFWWPELARQVRFEGRVQKLPQEESNAYFAWRPVESQRVSAASPQSQVIGSIDEVASALPEPPVTRPEHWGGFLLVPEVVEFWQGRPARLHDRFRYTREGETWRLERLAP